MTLRCLIVDDSPAFLATARSLLERQGFTVVATASNAQQALRLATDHSPDVVLLDIGLGDESGFDVARLLSSTAATAGLPVILVSTRATEDYGDLISSSPAVGFLPKVSLSAQTITDVLLSASRGT